MICVSPTSSRLHRFLPKLFLQAHSFLPQREILDCSFSAPQEVCEAVSAVRQLSHLSSCRWRGRRVAWHFELWTSEATSFVYQLMTHSSLNLLWIIDRAAVWSSSGRRRVFRLVTPGCFRCTSPFRKSTWDCGCAAALIPWGWKINSNQPTSGLGLKQNYRQVCVHWPSSSSSLPL